MKRYAHRIVGGVVTLVLTAVVAGAYSFGVFDTLQAQLTDRFFTISSAPKDIVVVAIDEATLQELGQWPFSRATHAALLEALQEARVVAFDVIFSEPSALGVADDATFADAIKAFPGTVVLPSVISEQTGVVSEPLPELTAVSAVGFVNTKPDRDGVVRRVELYRGEHSGFDVVVANTPVAKPTQTLITYLGPAGTVTTLSYADVYAGRVPRALFTDTTVLIGASAAGLGDIYQTPFGAMAGVEIHAQTIAMLQTGNFITPLPAWLSYVSFGLIALLIYGCVTYIRRLWLTYGSVLGVVLLVAGSAFMLFEYGYSVPHLYQIGLLMLVAGALVALQYITEASEKAFIKKGFTHYVASEVVDELARHPERLTLGGETKTLSILFSDIRGFTTLSEQLTPAELMLQLNEYLEEMSESVMNRRGLVDKYIGDAVMAFWGAPLPNQAHAINACESVIDMMASLKQLNERWAAEGRPAFAIGVGVSTGDVVVGNMGSKRRFNYSIIGDEVNFAARIEGLTKQYGVQCLIGEQTYQAIAAVPHLRTRELDDVMVKGKKEPRRIYELLTDIASEHEPELLSLFADGRKAYVAGHFQTAIAAFSQALSVVPTDGPSRVFLERSQALASNPPANWNGVFEFTTK